MISRRPVSELAKKLTVEAKRIVDEQMSRDDKATGMELKKQLAESAERD